MAPSGAGRRVGDWVLVWVLAGLTWLNAEAALSSSVEPACKSVDDIFVAVLNGGSNASSDPIVTLGPECNVLQDNHICTPIARSLLVEGSANGWTVWDTDLHMFQFSVEPGVNLTLRNLELARALVFTLGYDNMQPAIFHIRAGGMLVMENVTVRTLCATNRYYWMLQPGGQDSSLYGRPLHIADRTLSGVSLRNVTLACDPSVTTPSPNDLNVHGASMLTAFVAAASALTLPTSTTTTIRLMENITLPRILQPYNPDAPDPRVTHLTANVMITGEDVASPSSSASGRSSNSSASGGGGGGGLIYIDANRTQAWLYVQPPARLTLRGLVFTNMFSDVWAPGGAGGLLAGALPIKMVQTPRSPSSGPQPSVRIFEDSVLVVPRYEVVQMSYWCTMLNVDAPEFVAVADFLRSAVFSADCDVLDGSTMVMQRVRATYSLYTRVTLTSSAPHGVPSDPNVPAPSGYADYQHVNPPLFLVSSAADWAEAIAPVLPEDTWSSGASAASVPPSTIAASPARYYGGGAQGDGLPALLLLNGTIELTAQALRVPGGGQRVVRRSAVISAMRAQEACGRNGLSPCPPQPVLDLGNLIDAVRLEGPNTSILLLGLRLRNMSSTLTATMVLGPEEAGKLRSFFSFDRSAIHIIYQEVTLELGAEDFHAFHRYLSSSSRRNLPGNAELKSINSTCISFLSFNLGGIRGSNVDIVLVPGLGSAARDQPVGAADGGGDSGGGSSSNTGVIVGAVVGAVGGALLLAVGVGVFVFRRRRRRTSDGMVPGKQRGGEGLEAGLDAGAGAGALRPSEDDATRVVATRPEVVVVGGRGEQKDCACGGHGRTVDEESLPYTTGTVSIMTGCSDRDHATLLGSQGPGAGTGAEGGAESVPGAGPPLGHTTAMPIAVAGASEPMARRVFSLARSVPEDDLLNEEGVELSQLCSSGKDEASGSGSNRSASGAAPRRLLDPPAVLGIGESGLPAAGARSMLDPPAAPATAPAAVQTAGSVVTAAAAAAAAAAAVQRSGGGASCTTANSGVSKRMSRVLSAGRTHAVLLGEVGHHRSNNLRVRALGRSPSRPSRSAAASTGCGPTATALPAPAPAMLPSPELSARAGLGLGVSAMPPHALSTAVGSSGQPSWPGLMSRMGAERGSGSTTSRGRTGGAGGSAHGPQQRREMSQPALVTGRELCEPAAPRSAQMEPLMGGCGPLAPPYDPDSCSPGASTSISKVAVPEPASEVQRLISEMSGQGTEQLVILEPIGQGGYGMVYRGVWRNLDVAVKTVLFQDRANPAPTPAATPGPATASLPQSQVLRTEPIEEGEEAEVLGPRTRPGSVTNAGHAALHPCLPSPAAVGGGVTPSSSLILTGGTGGTTTHNWLLASTQAANSGTLPTVNVAGAAGAGCGGGGGGGGGAGGPLGVASQQRAVLEAAVSCSVAHPNVVATYHYDITPVRPSAVVCSGGLLVSDGSNRGPGLGSGVMSDWKLYLVQEFCDGGSLASALDTRVFHDAGGMPNLALTLCTLADIARGMAHIHSRSIVHGDLNPTNILLRSIGSSNCGIVPMWNRVASSLGAGGGGSGSATPGAGGNNVSAAATLRSELGVGLVAKVADFGLCGLLAPGKRHISNALRGTPFYTAPETVATGTLTKASDVYSFGVIAWEVYTGRPPFQHLPDQGFVRDESFPRLPPHVPPTFANMTLGCLNADSDARPTFEQILERLMSLQSKLAVSLQQRLSRLVAGGGALMAAGATNGAASPPPPPGYPLPLNTSPHVTLAPGSQMPYGPPGQGAAAPGTFVGPTTTVVTVAATATGVAGGGGSSTGVAVLGHAPFMSHSTSALPPGSARGAAAGSGIFTTAASSSLMGQMGLPHGVALANSVPNIQPMGSATSQHTTAAVSASEGA